jgi:hypothetical protein
LRSSKKRMLKLKDVSKVFLKKKVDEVTALLPEEEG